MSEYTDVMADFKNNLCDENQKVIEILKMITQKHILGTILDVGSGLGDITAAALSEQRVIHLDINDYSKHLIPSTHIREQWDFLHYTPLETIQTLFMCHVMQYIDDNIDILQHKMDEISPEYILLTLDTNDDFLGELAKWSLEYIPGANPELSYPWFPAGYDLKERTEYTWYVQASTWDELLKSAMCVLIDVSYDELSDDQKQGLIRFTQSKLEKPEFSINQWFHIYQKKIWK